MSLRTFVFLALFTGLSIVLAVFTIMTEPKYASVTKGDVVFPELVANIDDIGKLLIITKKRNMTMNQKDGIWTMSESDGFPIDSAQVRSAILGFAGLRYLEPKTSKKENYMKLDLRNPDIEGSRGRAVQIFDKQGKILVDVILGRARYNMPGTTKGGIYFRKPSNSQTWLGIGSLEVSRLPEDWLKTAIVNIPEKDIQEVRFYHNDGETVVVKRMGVDKSLVLQDMPPEKKLKYDSDLKNMAGVLENFQLEDAKKIGAINFGQVDTVTGEFKTLRDLSIKVTMSNIKNKRRDEEEYWVKVRAQSNNPSLKDYVAQINNHTSSWAFKIPAYKAMRLNKRFKDLLEDKKPISG